MKEQAEQRRHREAWANQRQDHDPECLPEIAPVYGGRLVEVARNLRKKLYISQIVNGWLIATSARMRADR